jgi:hypothetical protein
LEWVPATVTATVLSSDRFIEALRFRLHVLVGQARVPLGCLDVSVPEDLLQRSQVASSAFLSPGVRLVRSTVEPPRAPSPQSVASRGPQADLFPASFQAFNRRPTMIARRRVKRKEDGALHDPEAECRREPPHERGSLGSPQASVRFWTP